MLPGLSREHSDNSSMTGNGIKLSQLVMGHSKTITTGISPLGSGTIELWHNVPCLESKHAGKVGSKRVSMLVNSTKVAFKKCRSFWKSSELQNNNFTKIVIL